MDITSPPPTANFTFEFDIAQQLLEVEVAVEVMVASLTLMIMQQKICWRYDVT